MTDANQAIESAIARMKQIDRMLEEIGKSLPEIPEPATRLAPLFERLMSEANAAHGRFHRVAKQMMDAQKALARRSRPRPADPQSASTIRCRKSGSGRPCDSR